MIIGFSRFLNYFLVGSFSIFFFNLIFYSCEVIYLLDIIMSKFVEGLRLWYLVGFDSISLIFIILSGLLLIVCIFFSWYMSYKGIVLISLLSMSFFILINVFGVTDLLFFFFFLNF